MSTEQRRSMRLIVNGKAAGDPALRTAVHAIRDEGYRLEVRVTWEAGCAARYASEAVSDGVDVAIAAGGDGTINEVANGVLQASQSPEIAIGIVPYGTANDFATGCGIPIGDPLAALRMITQKEARPIDIGRVNDRFFVNVTSGGFGAEVTANTPPGLKRALGGAAYSLMGVITAAKMSPYRARLVAPGRKEEGLMIAMAVANGRQCGGGHQVTPKALLDDGLLDLMVVHDVELANFGVVLNELFDICAEGNQHVSYLQLASFSIESEQPIQMNLDGEPVRDTSFRFEALPKRLSFILPDEAPFVA